MITLRLHIAFVFLPLLLFLGLSDATAQPVWQSSNTAVGNTSTATVSRPANVEAGDLLVVGLMFEKGTDTAITPPSGWTLLLRTNASTNNGMATYYKIAGSSELASYGFSLTNGPKWAIGISRISNVNPEVPILAYSSNASTNSSAPVVALSVGAVPTNALVLSYFSNKKNATFTAPNGTTERYDAPNNADGIPSNMLATFSLTTAGATGNRTATPSESEAWVAQQIVVLGDETDTYISGGTFIIIPLGVTEILVEAWGGGGGGGRRSGNNFGQGAGGGAYARRIVSVTPGDRYDYFVGSGGLVPNSNNASGRPGAASTFSISGTSLLSANGGGGGGGGNNGVRGLGASATVSTGGIVSFRGGNGASTAGGGAGGSVAAGQNASGNTRGLGGLLYGGNGGNGPGGNGQGFGGAGAGLAGNSRINGGRGANGAIRISFNRTELILSQPADAIVGTRAVYTVSRATSSGSPVTTGAVTLDLSFLPQTSSAQFFANPIGGSPITSVTIPDGSSSATFYFTSTVPNTYTVTVSSTVYASVIGVIEFAPAPASKFVITQTNGQPIGPQLRNIPFDVRATLTDEFGNAVPNSDGSTTLTLTAAGGAIAGTLQFQNNLNAPVSATLTEGASFLEFSNVLYTGASGPDGFDVVITATGTGSGAGNGKTGQSNAFSVRNISLTVVAANASLVADGVSTTTVTATLSEVLSDATLTPIVGQQLRVSTDFGILIQSGNPIFQPTGFDTDANGQVVYTLRAGTVVGTATVTALCPGSCPATTTVQFIAGAPSAASSVLTASKTILSGDANNADILSVLTLRLRDAFGNPATTASAIAFTSSLGSSISSVENLGAGTYRATLTAEAPGTDLIGATIAASAIDATVEIRILPIEEFRTRQSGNWNEETTWQRKLPSDNWQNVTGTFPQPVLSESVTMPPLVAGVSASSSPFATTSHTISLPANIAAGDRLLLFWTDANTSTTVTTPSGWSAISNTTVSDYRRIIFQKTATESEQRTLIIETSSAERSAHAVVGIAAGTYDGTTVISTIATGTSASPDAPSLTSGFGAVGTLWLAAAFSSGDDNDPTPTAPTGFSGLITGYAGEGISAARMTIATRALSAASIDPAAFTLGSTVTWAAATVAVRGATVVSSPAATSALIRDTHTVTLTTANQPMDQVIVAQGGTMAFQGENAFTGLGPFVLQTGGTLRITSINGITATASTGNIRFIGVQGAAARTFASDATYIYESAFSQTTGDGLPAIVRNLTISNAAGVTLSGDVRLNGRLSLPNGTLTVPSGRTLDLDGFTGTTPTIEDGRIVLQSGALYRNLTVQRPRIEARRLITGSKGWRMVASPLNTTYQQMFSGFVTQGFAGSGFPSLQTNLMWWDESDQGTTLQGWRKPTTLSDSVVGGRGHFHYVFNGANRPDQPVPYDDVLPKTMSITGFEHPFNASSGTRFAWPLTFSSRDTTQQAGLNYVDRVTADAGWNLIGNPTASVLNWDEASAWTKTGLSSTIYVWDPSNNDYRVWNGTSGNLLSGLIAPFQAFWVQTDAADPVLSVSADAKSIVSTEFRGKEADSTSTHASVLTFSMDVVGRQSQTWLQFSESGRLGSDHQDAFRLSSPDNSWVTLHTRAPSANAAPMQINHLPTTFDEPTHLDLEIGAVTDLQPVSGTFTLSWERSATWKDNLYVLLMDHETRTSHELSTDGTFTFEYETPRSFAAKTVGGESLSLPMSPVAGYDPRAKLSETAYSRKTRFSLVVSNQPQDQYLPRTVALDQNYPNPFNPSTVIRFHLPEAQTVRLDVFDVLGRRVASLANGDFGAGSHQVTWNAGAMAGGVYLYRLSTRTEVITQKMTLLK